MPIVTGHYKIDRAKLPSKVDDLRIRFVSQLVNGKNTLLLLYPNSEPGAEPVYVRYAGGIKLGLGDGTVAEGIGQIVVTGKRLIGMITDGSVGKT